MKTCTFGNCLALCTAVVSGLESTPSTFRVELLLLFMFLLYCLICNSSVRSKHIQKLHVLARLAIIVHIAVWWNEAPSCYYKRVWSNEDPPCHTHTRVLVPLTTHPLKKKVMLRHQVTFGFCLIVILCKIPYSGVWGVVLLNSPPKRGSGWG